ncbi:MAG TPA: hypothetical protein VFN11_04130 [Ktedonobacterales bacterium]|nr:hypothetical protein [Ktedonobacterales bacterium]
MDELWLPGVIHRETEFVGGLTAACGPNALSMAERWADQSALSTLDVYRRMRAANLCDTSGSSTLSGLLTDAQRNHYTVASLPYHEPMPDATWRGFFQAHVGHQAIVFETANGQALVDSLTGKGENAHNLHYHFVMVAGWHPGGVSHHPQAHGKTLPPGWWCADGDNFDAGDVLQFYPDSVLAASKPCGALAITARAGNLGGGSSMGVPAGWKDDGTTLTAPNGVPVIRGMRAFVLANNWESDNWPLAPEAQLAQIEWGNLTHGPGARQDFRYRSLGVEHHADGSWGAVYRIWVGQDILALVSQLATAQQQIAQLQQDHQTDPNAAASLAALTQLAKALKLIAV